MVNLMKLTNLFCRENPAQTHRLIPWLNRELVVLMPPNHTNAIPTILEHMRDYLCQNDIQSREIRDYFLRYLHDKTDHFVHEFYNFAISPYDIVGYDRNVDYSSRETNVATVEISSNESSDGEVQVIDEGSAGSSSAVIRISPENITEVVLETTGAQEDSCIINDVHSNDVADDVPAASSEVVVESSDSECQFVLALKPPHLRTPEQVSLDSCSDSDVVFIPNEAQQPGTLFSSDTEDPEDNKPLSETRKQLKSEMDEAKFDLNLDLKDDPSAMDDNINMLNYGASTSTASQPDENVTNQKKFYYHPRLQKRVSTKSIFDSSSSSSSSESETSDEEWQSKMVNKSDSKHSKSSKTRRKNSRKLKKRRVSSTIVSHPKPLSELPSSGEAPGDNDALLDYPRVKSVIIKKQDDQHYIQKTSNSELSAE